MDLKNTENRREFLKGGLRSIMLGGIAVVTGFLGWREINSSEEDNLCVVNLPCRNCSKTAGCTYPDAVKFKQNKRAQ